MSRISPASHPILIPQRATFEEDMALKAGGKPVILTGFTIVAQLWRDERRQEKIADFEVVYVDRSNGLIRLRLSRSVTRAIGSNGFWDMLVIEPNGDADYWLEGPALLDLGLSDNQ